MVGKFAAVVSLDAFNLDSFANKGTDNLFEEVIRGVGILLGISAKDAEAVILVNGSILQEAKILVRNALAMDNLDVDLDTQTGMINGFVRLRFVFLLHLLICCHAFLTHNPLEAFTAAGISSLSQPAPQIDQTDARIAAVHVTDELEFSMGMFPWMLMRSEVMAGKGCDRAVVALPPEENV